MAAILSSVSHAESLDSVRLVGGVTDGTYSTFFSFIIETPTPEAPDPTVLTAEQYPLLAAIWDNEDDAVYDDM